MSPANSHDPAMDEFIAEGKEIIDRVAQCLQDIERKGGQSAAEQVSALYRDMHTLKGNAQLFGFKPIGLVAHGMEASLDPLRKSTGAIPSRLIDSCLRNLDLLDRMLKAVERGEDPICDMDEVTHSVACLVDASTSHFKAEYRLENESLPSEEVSQDSSLMKVPSPAPKIFDGSLTIATINEEIPPPLPAPVDGNEGAPGAGVSAAGAVPQTNQSEGTVRVQVALLDRILNLVGELVLVRNQLLQHRNRQDDPEFLSTSKTLDVVTSELQGEVMKTRMQPIESVVGKFQRLVRDTSRDLKKRIDLTLEGSETELDKSLLEAVKDPLTHIVRNSCDHGIEFPDERKKAGKPETGHLLIRSFHEGGQVVIEVSDDGRGLDRSRISAKALEKGLITTEQAARMGDREICELIFLPGFSTAQQVTSVSGRGVGMDVVKTNIEKIGGSVVISGVQGKGTTLQLRIPLTLAIVPALLIQAGGEKFAIPQVKLVELVRVGSESSAAQIEYLQGRPMYRLRGALLPLLDLREVTGAGKPKDYSQGAYLVVLNTDTECFGLIVDEIMDTADIVVKPLGAFLNQFGVFSGSTILGDGSIALILDVAGVAAFGKVLGKRSHDDQFEAFSRREKAAAIVDIQEFLLLSVGTDATHAIPLCLVQRLEEFDAAAIEFSGEQRVAQYRGALLPLLELRSILNYRASATQGAVEARDPNKRIAVVVVQRSGRNFGIVVEEILDVVTIDGVIDDAIRDRDGILGNIIFQDSVIVVVDALGVIEKASFKLGHAARPNLRDDSAHSKSSSVGALDEIRTRNRDIKLKKIRVLYAEDVAFFRRHVSKVLNDAGMDVTTVEDGAKALEEISSASPGQYNLILSDIEMPKMTGLELAREVRKRKNLDQIPLIALSTRFRDKDIVDGHAAGFDVYMEKLNPEKLLEAIERVMSTQGRPKEAAAP